MATAAEREAQVRYFFDVVWNQRRYEEADKLYGPAYVNLHAPGLTGGEAKCAHLRGWHTAFPDLCLSIEHDGQSAAFSGAGRVSRAQSRPDLGIEYAAPMQCVRRPQ
jgi:hypothetical protein